MADLASVLADTPALASLPSVYKKIKEAVDDPRVSSRDIAGIISEDAALAVRLLKLANSAYFGFPGKVETITQAVTMIGMKELRELVLASSVTGMFNDIPQEIVNVESFVQYSVAVGLCARVIATYRREQNVEKYFVAGLLHDIGGLVIYTHFAEEAVSILQRADQSGQSTLILEAQEFGFDRAVIGQAFMQDWALPDSLVASAAYAYQPAKAGEHLADAAIVHMSMLMVKAFGMGSNGDAMLPELDAKAMAVLDLSPAMIPSILKDLDKQFKDSLEFLSLAH